MSASKNERSTRNGFKVHTHTNNGTVPQKPTAKILHGAKEAEDLRISLSLVFVCPDIKATKLGLMVTVVVSF
jgi:hypothetical protein